MKPAYLFCATLLGLAAAGCTSSTEFDGGRLTLTNDGQIALHAPAVPEALISPSGDLTINGKRVQLEQTQRDLVVRYFTSANAIREDGFATGMAGASTALTALGSVVSGLAGGEPDKIGPAVDAKAAKVQAHVEKLCRDLRELAATQDALAASLPAFKSYALIEHKDVNDCHAG